MLSGSAHLKQTVLKLITKSTMAQKKATQAETRFDEAKSFSEFFGSRSVEAFSYEDANGDTRVALDGGDLFAVCSKDTSEEVLSNKQLDSKKLRIAPWEGTDGVDRYVAYYPGDPENRIAII